MFSLDLNEFNEGAVTTLLGREFHTSTTRFENTPALTFSRERRLKIFKLLPLVGKFDMVKNLLGSILLIWFKIVYTSTTSALNRLYSSVGIPSALSLFSYVRPDSELTNRVALFVRFLILYCLF